MSFPLMRVAVVVGTLGLTCATACGGSSSPSTQSAATVAFDPAAGAAKAAAACQAVNQVKPAKSQSRAAQDRYLKDIVAGFRQARTLADQAADYDPKWTELADTASKESAAFAKVLEGSTAGVELEDQQSLITAMNATQTNRPLFIAECQKAIAAANK